MGYTRDQLVAIARQKAQTYGIDPDLYVRQIEAESSFNPQAVSPAGAQGIAQFMPGTAKGVGLENPYDPVTALDAGAKHLSQLYKRYDGNMELALAAYNAGPGAVDKYNGVPPFKETQHYVAKIMGRDPTANVSASVQGDPVAAKQGSALQTAYSKTTSAKMAPSPVNVAPYGYTEHQQRINQLLSKRMQGNIFDANQPSLMDLASARMQADGTVASGIPRPADALGEAFQPSTQPDAVQPTQGDTGAPIVPLEVEAGKGVKNVEGAAPVVAEAMRYMGTKYTWGGESPETGFDCSGFTQYLYAKQGIQLPRVAADQYKATARVAKGDLAEGDLVFFRGSTGRIDHMGLYIGGGNFIHSPRTGDVVKISSLGSDSYSKRFAGGGRPG